MGELARESTRRDRRRRPSLDESYLRTVGMWIGAIDMLDRLTGTNHLAELAIAGKRTRYLYAVRKGLVTLPVHDEPMPGRGFPASGTI